MTKKRKNYLLAYLYAALLLFFAGNGYAICEHQGLVINAGQTEGCTVLIAGDNGEVYVPVNHLNELTPGAQITFSYEPDTTTTCQNGIPINITCLEFLNDNCGYVIDFTQSEDTITISIHNTTDFGPYTPQVVEWIDPESGEILSTSPEFSIELTEPVAGVREICAGFSATFPDSTVCNGFICKDIYFQWDCFDITQIDNEVVCPESYQPVCGCDSITYSNQCEAFYHGGVSSWTPGPCQQAATCEAFFVGYTEQQNSTTFYNYSTGDYTDALWEFGDGTSSESTDEIVIHNYQIPGFYTVSLSIQNENSDCSSIFQTEIYTGSPEDICQFGDCVYPGDANIDTSVNVYDVLAVGLGYGYSGPTNPEYDETLWLGQFVPDWNTEFLDTIDVKHADCDGNGFINEDDINVIDDNYTPEAEVPFQNPADGLPVELIFNIDTLFITDNMQGQVEVSAYLNVGTENEPVIDMYGLALQLDYPEDLLNPNTVLVDYYDNSFLGTPNEILSLQKDSYNLGRKDVAFTRKDRGEGVSGSGKIARVDFIIIVDIIGGYTEPVPFSVDPQHILITDSQGGEIPVKRADKATFVIVDNRTTGIKKTGISGKIAVYPNPATKVVNIYTGDSRGKTIEVFNALGQRILTQDIIAKNTSLTTTGWNEGIYFLKIVTEEGTITKKILIEK